MWKNTFDIKIQSLLVASILLDFVLIVSCLFYLSCIRSSNFFLNTGIPLQTSPSKLLSQGIGLALFPKTIITFIPS